MHISEKEIHKKLDTLRELIEAFHDIPERKKQLLSLIHMYGLHVLPFLSIEQYTKKTMKIILAACGEYIGAIDAIASSLIFSPAVIHAFDKYIDMHTKELYLTIAEKIYTSTRVTFREGDVYKKEDFIIFPEAKNDIIIVRNISPELRSPLVLQNILDALDQNGLLIITTLSHKESYAVRKILDKEIKIALLHYNPVTVDGFIMNDEYIFVCRKV